MNKHDGTLVLTSRNLYGKIITKTPEELQVLPSDIYKIKIGSKIHLLFDSQFRPVDEFIRLKVYYKSQKLNEEISDYQIVEVPRNLSIWDIASKDNLLINYCKDYIFKTKGLIVSIINILIP